MSDKGKEELEEVEEEEEEEGVDNMVSEACAGVALRERRDGMSPEA